MTTTLTTTTDAPVPQMAVPIYEKFRPLADLVRNIQDARQFASLRGDNLIEAMIVADGMKRIREVFTPEHIADIASLGGTSLGWRHDLERDGKQYPPDRIRDCAIEAALRGLQWTGNQFNIIGARCYTTKEGYTALLSKHPGLTSLVYDTGIPEFAKEMGKQDMVYVSAYARCKVNGIPVLVECYKTDEFDGRLAVKTFAGEIDNPKGKATRRVLKILYERITNSPIDEPDDGVETAGKVQVIEQQPKPAAAAITETTIEQWSKERQALTTDESRQYWDDMSDAMQESGLQQIAEDLAKKQLATKDRESLRRWFSHRKQQLAGAE